MTENQPSDLRIGDAEREEALRALGDHMSAGRLDIDEYGERTARVATAKTRGDLLLLFGDLPEPRPRFITPVPLVPPVSQPAPVDSRPPAHRIWSALVPISAVVGVLLFVFLLRGFWPILLLPIAITFAGGHLFGDSWRREHREIQRRRRQDRRLRGDYR